MKNKRGIALITLIIIIAVILVICGGVFYIILNNEQVENYESQEDKYEVKTKNEILNKTNVINSNENDMIVENISNSSAESEIETKVLIFQELEKYEGESKSYEETYSLLTQYYKNCAGLVAESMNGNVKIDLDIALDISKASSKLLNAEQSLKEYANKYLNKSRTYTISVSLQSNNNIDNISIKSEKINKGI